MEICGAPCIQINGPYVVCGDHHGSRTRVGKPQLVAWFCKTNKLETVSTISLINEHFVTRYGRHTMSLHRWLFNSTAAFYIPRSSSSAGEESLTEQSLFKSHAMMILVKIQPCPDRRSKPDHGEAAHKSRARSFTITILAQSIEHPSDFSAVV